jgi:protein-S-isoprenylcysteine O-methyltransferase Ste14
MVSRLFYPDLDKILIPLLLPYDLSVRISGAMLMLVSFFFISYTHAYMAAQWQSGLQLEGFKLLENGPYRRCRHPLFSAVMLGMLGFALALPSVFTLVCYVVGVFALTRQAAEEERGLLVYADYRSYSQRTAKWPWPVV